MYVRYLIPLVYQQGFDTEAQEVTLPTFYIHSTVIQKACTVRQRDMEYAMQPLGRGAQSALDFITGALEQIVAEVQRAEHGSPAITLNRLDSYDPVLSQDLLSTEFKAKSHQVTYGWPGKTAEEAWRFGQMKRLSCENPLISL
jgi:hypothetical protein